MEIFEISGDRRSPVVVSVPHNGTWVPGEIREKLAVPVEGVRRKVDEFAWELARVAGGHAFQIEVNREACRRDFGRMERSFREFWAYVKEDGIG